MAKIEQIKKPPHPTWLAVLGGLSLFTVLLESNVGPQQRPLGYLLFEIPYLVILCIFLFRLWKLAQQSNLPNKKPSPGKAIGFMFVPFFNLYWLFIAHRNLALHLNSLTRHNKVPVALVTVGIALLISVVLSFAGLIILLITYYDFYDAGKELLEAKGEGS